MSQAQMGQSQAKQPQGEVSLLNFLLPEGPITDNDMPYIKIVIQKVVNNISEYVKSEQKPLIGSDGQPIVSGIRIFKNWLTQQKCIQQVSIPYDDPTKYSSDFLLNYIFLSYPGQIPINIVFITGEGKTAEYRLLLFVSTVDFLRFASLIMNKK